MKEVGRPVGRLTRPQVAAVALDEPTLQPPRDIVIDLLKLCRGIARAKVPAPAAQHRVELRDEVAQVNPVLRGWGAYFRTGNAAIKFGQVDDYVAWRLKRLLVKRYGRHLRPGHALQWTPAFFHALGLYRLRGTIRYPEAA